jgi:NADPH:quinone reductase-like Zn-dependent oxidoreductase
MRSGLSTHAIAVGSRVNLIDLLSAMQASTLRPVIDRVFPFSQAVDAYRHLGGRTHVGKVVIAADSPNQG